MSRFPLILFAGMTALSFPAAGAFGDEAAPPPAPPSAPSDSAQSGPGAEASDHQADRNRTADLQREVGNLQDLAKSIKEQLDLRAARRSGPNVGKQQDGPEQEDADLQRQDGELHGQLQSLIAQLDKQLQLELRSPPIPDPEDQQRRQAALNAFKGAISDLRQLQGLTAQHQEIAPPEAPPAPDVAEKQAARDPLETHVPDLLRQIADLQQQNADLQHQNADLQRQNDELRDQLAEQEGKYSVKELAQREADVAGQKVERLRQDNDRLHQQTDEASLARQKTPAQQKSVRAAPAPPAAQKTPRSTQQQSPQSALAPTSPQSSQHVPDPQPTQPLPAPAAARALQTARQWLAAGRPDEARRVLAMVQTEMVYQTSTPEDRRDATGPEPAMADVRAAIRWLDMGAGDRANESITRAIDEATSEPPGAAGVRTWSGYRTGTR
jgi:regulator of replication initiation timing